MKHYHHGDCSRTDPACRVYLGLPVPDADGFTEFVNPFHDLKNTTSQATYRVRGPTNVDGDIEFYKTTAGEYIAVHGSKVLTECVTVDGCRKAIKNMNLTAPVLPGFGVFEDIHPSHRFVLIACSSNKDPDASIARNLYKGSLFQKSVAAAEACGATWFVLSAKYGLLSPNSPVRTYDETLSKMTSEERRQWRASTHRQILQVIEHGAVVILAGELYREGLEQKLASRRIHSSVPMRGMRIGEQLQFLTRALEHVA